MLSPENGAIQKLYIIIIIVIREWRYTKINMMMMVIIIFMIIVVIVIIMIIIVIVVIMIMMMVIIMIMVKRFDNNNTNRIIITERGTCKELISIRRRQFKTQGRVCGRGRKANKQFTHNSENKQ